MTTWKRGSELPYKAQQEALRAFTRRDVAGNFLNPRIAGEPNYANDVEWLAGTLFAVADSGTRLARNVRHCRPVRIYGGATP